MISIDGLTSLERQLKKLNMAYDEADGYKKNQLECKIKVFKLKHFPKVFWESKKGTYRKPKRINK